MENEEESKKEGLVFSSFICLPRHRRVNYSLDFNTKMYATSA